MDDFSWGNTRVVTGESGRQVLITDEGKFDPESIPRKKWEEYQAELWEAQTSYRDDRSEASGISYGTKSFHPAASSEYGYPPSRPMSQLDLPGYSQPRGSVAMHQMGRSSTFGDEMADYGNLPSDDAILSEIREILKTADLMSVTKKSVKLELERRFGVALDAKKAYIGSATEAVLSGQL